MNILIPKRNKLIAVVSLALILICIAGTVLKIRGKNTVDPKRANEYILGELNDENLVGAFYCGDFRVMTYNKKPGKIRLALFNDKGETISETDNVEEVDEFQNNDKCGSFHDLRARVQSCEMNRSIINTSTEVYYFTEGTWPRDDLADIKTNVNYFPDGIPTCPVDLTSYVLLPSPYHRVSGHREGESTHIYSETEYIKDEWNIQTLFDLFSEDETLIIVWKYKNNVYAMSEELFNDVVFVFDEKGIFKNEIDASDRFQYKAIMKLFIQRMEDMGLLE